MCVHVRACTRAFVYSCACVFDGEIKITFTAPFAFAVSLRVAIRISSEEPWLLAGGGLQHGHERHRITIKFLEPI